MSAADIRRIVEYVEKRQEDDWDRLSAAIRRAANGYWSIECAGILSQIRQGVELTGPTRPGVVPWDLTRDGIYTLVTGEEVAEFVAEHREMMERQQIPALPTGAYYAVKAEMQREVEW